MAPRRTHNYPRAVYGPHGAHMTIQRAEDWPKGWTERPENDIGPPPIILTGSIPLSRVELKTRLRAAGVAFKETDSNTALWAKVQGIGK